MEGRAVVNHSRHSVQFPSGSGWTRASDAAIRTFRLWLLVLLACDLALVAVRVATYPAFFAMPGALGYLIEPVAALAIYAAAILALPFVVARYPGMLVALKVGIVVGLVGGCIEVVSTALESLVALPQWVVSIATGAAMLGLFLLFGVAGFIGGRRANSFWLGLASAICCAMFAILLVVAFGFSIINTSLPTLAHDEIHDPDYLRSGWTDVRAFAIANTFDAGFTHLVEAPLIAAALGAAALGAAGSGAGRIGARRPTTPGLASTAATET
jgi:hypothetical protein